MLATLANISEPIPNLLGHPVAEQHQDFHVNDVTIWGVLAENLDLVNLHFESYFLVWAFAELFDLLYCKLVKKMPILQLKLYTIACLNCLVCERRPGVRQAM